MFYMRALALIVESLSALFQSWEHKWRLKFVASDCNYSGRARRSGKKFTARFAHVWARR
jgi:hypothetical protein